MTRVGNSDILVDSLYIQSNNATSLARLEQLTGKGPRADRTPMIFVLIP